METKKWGGVGEGARFTGRQSLVTAVVVEERRHRPVENLMRRSLPKKENRDFWGWKLKIGMAVSLRSCSLWPVTWDLLQVGGQILFSLWNADQFLLNTQIFGSGFDLFNIVSVSGLKLYLSIQIWIRLLSD